MIPQDIKRVVRVKAPKVGKATRIDVLGHRDPRGPDNSIHVWVDEDDKLHINVYKAKRCYTFESIEENGCYIEVIAS